MLAPADSLRPTLEQQREDLTRAIYDKTVETKYELVKEATPKEIQPQGGNPELPESKGPDYA